MTEMGEHMITGMALGFSEHQACLPWRELSTDPQSYCANHLLVSGTWRCLIKKSLAFPLFTKSIGLSFRTHGKTHSSHSSTDHAALATVAPSLPCHGTDISFAKLFSRYLCGFFMWCLFKLTPFLNHLATSRRRQRRVLLCTSILSLAVRCIVSMCFRNTMHSLG